MYIDTPDDLVLTVTQGNGVVCPLAGTAKHPIITHVVFLYVLGGNMAWYRCTHCRQTWPIELEEPADGDHVQVEDYKHPYDDRRRVPYR